jgi:transposase
VEQFELVRGAAREEAPSVRELARRFEVHRRTVRQALVEATPPARKAPVRTAPAVGSHVDTVRGWLVADLAAPRRQRHTARRVWQRLVDEEGAIVAESTVRHLVAQLRREVGSGTGQVIVPQTHLPAEEAEVDFGSFVTELAGEPVGLSMFVLRLSHSGRAVHIAYGNESQESFLDGHVKAFDVLGGVPAGTIRYDNLRTAAVRVLLGRERWENPRFVALRSHYGYDSWFCRPGSDGAHEKGGVEGEIGRFRAATCCQRRRCPRWPNSTSCSRPAMLPTTPDTSAPGWRRWARLQPGSNLFCDRCRPSCIWLLAKVTWSRAEDAAGLGRRSRFGQVEAPPSV